MSAPLKRLNDVSSSHAYSEVDQGEGVCQAPLDDASSQGENDSVVDVSLITHSRWQRSLKVAMLFMVTIGLLAIGLHLAPTVRVSVGNAEELSLGAYRNGTVAEIKDVNDTNTCHSFRCHPKHGPHLTELTARGRPFLKEQGWLIQCPKSGCNHDLCCDRSCFNYTCPQSRPYLNLNPYLRNCKTANCTDSFCCHPLPETCMDMTCNETYVPRAMRWEIKCPDNRCSHDRCCKKMPSTCATTNMTCPVGYRYKFEYEYIKCNSVLGCPFSTCCEKGGILRNCSGFKCPSHYGLNPRSWDIRCNGTWPDHLNTCDIRTCCHTLYPPWAKLGMSVVSGNSMGNITSLKPVEIKIAWRNGTVTDPVNNWSGIAMAAPPWARTGMQVQDATFRAGRIANVRPYWKVHFSDGSVLDSARNWSASFWGLVQLPPPYAVRGAQVIGPFGKTGVLTRMPRARIEWKDGQVLDPVPNWDGIVEMPPHWAASGVKVVFRDGETGDITTMLPLPVITRETKSVLSPVRDWVDICQAPPTWARKGMKVQSASLKVGKISVLRPLWAIEWLDGSKTDSATNGSATWQGIAQLPPSWVAVGVKVHGPRGKVGIIASMPRARIDWADGEQQSPVLSWERIYTGSGTPENADVRIALSLVLSIIFVMLLFTLVNFEADDVRRNTWNIFAGVASVFMAYLLFSTVNRIAQSYAVGAGDVAVCVIKHMIFFSWVGLGLLVSAFVSGVLGEGSDHTLDEEVWVKADYLRSDYGYPIYNSMHVRNCEGVRSICIIQGVEVPVEKKKRNLEVRQQSLKCWGMLFADVAGFAAISAGGSLQHLGMFSSNATSALVSVLITQCLISAMYTCFGVNGKPDGLTDLRKRMFVEETSASEVDVSALTFSFLLVQVLRFKLTGSLPDANGNLELEGIEPYGILYFCGLVFGITSLLLIAAKSGIVSPREESVSGSARFLNISSAALALCCAWCIVFATSALLRSYTISSRSGIGVELIFGRCMLALSLSIACMLGIWVNGAIEKVCRRIMKYRPYSSEVVLRIITAESLFVGYSWVSAFSESVEVVCSSTPNPLLSQFLLVIFASLVIMPAWQKYIVPKTMLLHAYHLRKLAGAVHGKIAVAGTTESAVSTNTRNIGVWST